MTKIIATVCGIVIIGFAHALLREFGQFANDVYPYERKGKNDGEN